MTRTSRGGGGETAPAPSVGTSPTLTSKSETGGEIMTAMQTMRDKLESIAPALANLDEKQAWYMAGYVACAVDMAKQDEKPVEKAKAN